MIGESNRYRAAWYKISLRLPDAAAAATTTSIDGVTGGSNNNNLARAATGTVQK